MTTYTTSDWACAYYRQEVERLERVEQKQTLEKDLEVPCHSYNFDDYTWALGSKTIFWDAIH